MTVPLKTLSKGIAQALRHRPAYYGLEPDAEGWVPLADLLAGLCRRRHRCDVTIEDVQAVPSLPDKQRYEIKDGRIRALYGHSNHVSVRKETAVPFYPGNDSTWLADFIPPKFLEIMES